MTSSEEFTDEELDYFRSLVRIEIRHIEANIRQGERRWGAEYRKGKKTRSIAMLEDMYRKLGKDPDDITYMAADDEP